MEQRKVKYRSRANSHVDDIQSPGNHSLHQGVAKAGGAETPVPAHDDIFLPDPGHIGGKSPTEGKNNFVGQIDINQTADIILSKNSEIHFGPLKIFKIINNLAQ
jgi:hypothetical protein